MKKNKTMRLAAILLVCVLLTTCVISGTFAKYTGSDDVTVTARVAKWGWGTNTLTLDLFAKTYNETGTVTVDGGTDNVIAPGTSKSAALTWVADEDFAPEVSYALTFSAEAEIPTEIEEVLTWSLKNEGSTTSYASFDLLVAALEDLSVEVPVGQDAPTLSFEIGWAWAFNEDTTSNATDNALGNANPLAELEITFTLTAAQID